MIMGEDQYIATALPHPGGLSGHSNLAGYSEDSTASHTSSYQDLTPFSTGSTFTVPAQCDSSLLTPSSSAASPPLHQVHQRNRNYSVAPGTPQSQDAASPDDQKMYQAWANHLELNGHPSGTSSPMTNQASVSTDYLEPYMAEGRRTPAPPPTYLGNFAVSDPSEPHQIQQQPDSPYYHLGMSQIDHQTIPMRDAPPMTMEAAHHRSMSMVPSIPGSSTMTNSPLPPTRQERRDSLDDNLFHHYTNVGSNRGPSASPAARPKAGPSRVTKKSRPSRRQNRARQRTLDPAAEHKNCYGEEVPPTLKADTPAQERCIWDARWKHRYSKGQNMWDNIWAEYDRTFESHKVPRGRGARENLQMKFKRSRSKFLQWLPKDDEILAQAWHIMEQDRYRTLLNLFTELGGSRNMCLGVEDIEVRVVHHLKFEEDLYMEAHGDVGIRRRRRVSRSSKKRGEDDALQHDVEMAHGPEATHGTLDHDAIIDQVFGCRTIKDEEDFSDNGTMDATAWSRQMDTKMNTRGHLAHH
jgi:hypothetical protein